MTQARRVGLQAVLVALVSSLFVVIGSAPGFAVEDLVVTGDTVYRVNVDESRVDVTSTYSLRNTKPNTRRGYTITRYYFDTAFFVLPREAENIAVTSNGRSVDFDEQWDDGTRYLEIDLPSRLFYQQTRVLDVTFALDGALGSTAASVRVNPAHVSMWAWAYGDPGRAGVTIELPDGFELDWVGSDGAVEDLRPDFSDPDIDAWHADDIEDPDSWWVSATGDRPSALEVSSLDIAGISIEIRSWPGDHGWYSEVTETLDEGLAALTEAVGLDWPVEDALVLSESSVPNRYGYGGWYFTDLDEIEIGEEVDEMVVLHEVSHAWFNDALFVERWISEGLAEAVPAYVLRDTFGEQEFPTIVNRTTRHALPLNQWTDPDFDQDDDESAQELWAYNASYWTMHQLIDEIGIDGLRAVLQAAFADEIAYRGSVPIETVEETDDWRRLLDLLEEVGGSERATDLFLDLVVASLAEEPIAARSTARGAYDRLEESSGWAMPIYVRQSMEDWRFDDASEAMTELLSFLTRRNSHEVESLHLGFDVPDFQGAYETVEDETDIMAMDEVISERRAVLAVYLEARDAVHAPRDLRTTIGLNELAEPGLTLRAAHEAFNDGDLEAATALAQRVHLELAFAAAVGQERLADVIAGFYGLLALLAVGLLWSIVRWRRRRRARHRNRAASDADEVPPEEPGVGDRVVDAVAAGSAGTGEGATASRSSVEDPEVAVVGVGHDPEAIGSLQVDEQPESGSHDREATGSGPVTPGR